MDGAWDDAARARLTRGMDRLHALVAGRTRPHAALIRRPEPSGVGSAARGRRIAEGSFLLAGHPVRTRGRSIWDVPTPVPTRSRGTRTGRPDPAFEAARHGFAWLGDLAAFGTDAAQALAGQWSRDWIRRYGRGTGPGWTPGVAGRRALAWIDHADFALSEGLRDAEIARALARQALFLRLRWRGAPPGPERIAALAGLIRSALSVEGLERHAAPAARALADAAGFVGPDGAIPSRDPEALLDALALLTGTAATLRDAGMAAPEGLRAAIGRAAPALRVLRHADGGLARFHGGGRGAEGLADRALAEGGVRPRPGGEPTALAMGFARLRAGRTTVIVDVAPPASGPGSGAAHASTLAIEVTSGRRPLIVSCGPGGAFGSTWLRAGRATASHSTLDLEGVSSSRAAPDGADAPLIEIPHEVRRERYAGPDGPSLKASHDGWRESHGLTHARELDLAPDGRSLRGEDTLAALTEADTARFAAALERLGPDGLAWAVRFHLHPDAEARPSPDGGSVRVGLTSGEVWILEHDGAADLRLDPSVYLEPARARPVRAEQIVLAVRSDRPVSRVRWSLSKADGVPGAIRDHGPPPDAETPG